MVQPELRDIQSPDLLPPALPDDPTDCVVRFQAVIGPRGGTMSESFAFAVVTPAFLRRAGQPLWGRGLLVVTTFEWAAIVQAVAELLARAARPTWEEVAVELNKELQWELGRDLAPDA